MKPNRNIVIALVSVLVVAVVLVVLRGCGSSQEPNDPGYYSGKEFKRGGGSTPGAPTDKGN